MCEASAAVAPVSKQCLGSAYFSVLLLEMSCKICQDHARLTWTNVQKSYKSVLERFLQESYKILQELPSKILQECSCKVLARILQDKTFKILAIFLPDS